MFAQAWGLFLSLLVLTLLEVLQAEVSLWHRWWTYRGISGPNYWGLLNPKWKLCTDGKRQSPINIDLQMLLFDPTLSLVHVGGDKANGVLMNNGNEVTLEINDTAAQDLFITAGPLSYKYCMKHIKFHFGSKGFNGGEHHINGLTFPAELQIMAYNCELYDNFTQAERSPHGLSGLAIFAQIGKKEHEDFDVIAHAMKRVRFKGQRNPLHHINIKGILPNTTQYITYEGSLTQPGCHETVTWILLNRPIYVSRKQIDLLRALNKGGFENPQMLLERNSRPVRPVNHRVIRTNINFNRGCTMKKDMFYEGQRNPLHHINIKRILPNTTQYITYEGSLTQQGCRETVTWILLNRPIYVSRKEIDLLRALNKGGFENPQMLLERNSRPVRPVNHRVIRTNIIFNRGCTMKKDMFYEGQRNPLHHINIKGILPNTTQYITYEGSLTQPGCHETVTWILLNRPIYVSRKQIDLLRALNKGGFENPQMLLERNSRPV